MLRLLTGLAATPALPAAILCAACVACATHTDLAILIYPRVDSPVVQTFDGGRGLRFVVHDRGVRTKVTFLTKKRIEAIARRLFPSGRIGTRVPDLVAVELDVFNGGHEILRVDFRRFKIRMLSGEKEFPAISPAAYEREYFGAGAGGLPYAWAFEQKDSFAYHLPVPDWFRAASARFTGSRLEIEERRAQDLARLEALHAERTLLAAGHSLKGIVLFGLLPPDRDYSFLYSGARDGGFEFAPFDFRLELRRGPFAPDPSDGRDAWAASFAGDEREIRQETAEFMRMHEQLRAHDRLRQGADAR